MECEWNWINPGPRDFAVENVFPRISPEAESAERSEERTEIEIFRAVLRRLCASHRPNGKDSIKPILFILHAPHAAGEGNTTERLSFSEAVRSGVSRGARDLPMRIVWVEDAYRVGDDPRGEYVPGGGAVARLRVLRRDGADLAFVEGNIHAWGMPPLWFEYLVQKKAGFWMVKSCYHRWMS